MPYCTLGDITARLDEELLIQLTDDEGIGIVNESRVTATIAEADSEIDSYLSGRYTVPLDPVPAVIKKLSADIAIWNLYSRREKVEEAREKRYDAAIKLLRAISDGKATLGVDPEPSGGEQQIKAGRDKTDRAFTIGKKSSGESGTLDNY